ncbi:MAG: 4Fe-4S binding protein [Desulfobacteraceae bacterium]|nr:4Fe-4S binding protein [Desulfobacteraceae bacterium]
MQKKYVGLRLICQVLFLITTLFIGYKFYQFAAVLSQGVIPITQRPPGVEAFLPIAALTSLKYFFINYVVDPIHPSGLLIFLFIVLTAFLVKKSFCSWVCPIGFLSEILSKLHSKLFKKGFRIYPGIDFVLRSFKYFLLAFFLFAIFYTMNPMVLKQFIFSSYNIVADIKMLKFFTDISVTVLVSIVFLVMMSIIIRYFWCRYLCPYGALLGIVGLLSPFKVRRDFSTCTACKKCDRACPCSIIVSEKNTIASDECFACGKCVDACPEADTLFISLPKKKLKLSPLAIACMMVAIFAGGSFLARSAGLWHNGVTNQAYLTAMLENNLIDVNKVANMDTFVSNLDKRGKRLLMMKLIRERKE